MDGPARNTFHSALHLAALSLTAMGVTSEAVTRAVELFLYRYQMNLIDGRIVQTDSLVIRGISLHTVPGHPRAGQGMTVKKRWRLASTSVFRRPGTSPQHQVCVSGPVPTPRTICSGAQAEPLKCGRSQAAGPATSG